MKKSIRPNCTKYAAILVLAAVCSTSANATLLSHRYSFNGNTTDSVGTANLSLTGSASVSGGQLDLPGGSTRTNNASAQGSALTELANTINSSSAISMEIWFAQDQRVTWSKLFMAGSSTAQNMDITSSVGSSGKPKIQINDSTHGEYNVTWNTASLSNATDYYIAAIWDTAINTQTIYAGQVGGTISSFSSSMGGNTLANVGINQLYLGSAVAYGDNDFNGQIDEYRVWSGALSGAEVSANFAAGANASFVPEPATLVLFGIGLVGMTYRRRTADQ